MKSFFITLQRYLIDIIIVSIIVIIGMFSLLGLFYAVTICFTFLEDEIVEKWRKVFNIRIFLRSLILQFFLFLVFIINLLNIQIFPYLTNILRLVLIPIIIIFDFIIFNAILWLLWKLKDQKKLNLMSFAESINIVLGFFPLIFTGTIVTLILIFVTFLYPVTVILTIGLVIMMYHQIYLKIDRQLSKR